MKNGSESIRPSLSPCKEGLFLFLAQTIGLLYLVLIPFDIKVAGPLRAQDLLSPFMIVAICLNPLRFFSSIPRHILLCLGLFLIVAFTTSIFHFAGVKDVYEFMIFAYMLLIFLYFSSIPMPSKTLFLFGSFCLSWMFLALLWDLFMGGMRTYDVYSNSSLDFIARRYYFNFDHPNLTGSFYVLPLLCVILGAKDFFSFNEKKRLVLFIAVISIALIPLAFTISKHLIMSVAMILGMLASYLFPSKRRALLLISCTVLSMIFFLFYLTVLFPFFPLSNRFPWFNNSSYGMYITHQEIYFRIITSDWKTFLFGLGRENLIVTYPRLADADYIYGVLSQYKQEFLTQVYCSYMDAHNEYLNIGANYGVLALGLLYASLFCIGVESRKCSNLLVSNLLLLLVISIFMVSFWDDILSKRWIWASLGILVSHAGFTALRKETSCFK